MIANLRRRKTETEIWICPGRCFGVISCSHQCEFQRFGPCELPDWRREFFLRCLRHLCQSFQEIVGCCEGCEVHHPQRPKKGYKNTKLRKLLMFNTSPYKTQGTALASQVKKHRLLVGSTYCRHHHLTVGLKREGIELFRDDHTHRALSLHDLTTRHCYTVGVFQFW